MTEATTPSADFAGLTADIVSAFVSNNAVSAAELPTLISQVHGALTNTAAPQVAAAPARREPVVQIKKSVTPDHLISLIDGRKYKSLRRHLSAHGMTPETYRTEFNLPSDYPMVAANYSAQRSSLARSLGLGRKATAPTEAAIATRGRPRKAA